MEIITNYHKRPIIYAYELTERERREFAGLVDNLEELEPFVRYKGNIIPLCDFARVDATAIPEFKGWDGYVSDSFFSGILIRFDEEDSDYVVLATYIG